MSQEHWIWFRATVSIGRVRMRVRAATARMHAHTHVILAISSQKKGPQETKTRVVVLPGLCFAGTKAIKNPRAIPAWYLSGSVLRVCGGDLQKEPRA